jgi:hypothetical protein
MKQKEKRDRKKIIKRREKQKNNVAYLDAWDEIKLEKQKQHDRE